MLFRMASLCAFPCDVDYCLAHCIKFTKLDDSLFLCEWVCVIFLYVWGFSALCSCNFSIMGCIDAEPI